MVTLKTISGIFASILGFISLSSASLSPTPTPAVSVVDQRATAIKEFHNLELSLAGLKIQQEFPRILKRGLQGSDVKQLQQDLNTLIPSFSEANISGYFGSLTEKTVKQFQTEHSLPASGIFDSSTQNVLVPLIAKRILSKLKIQKFYYF